MSQKLEDGLKLDFETSDKIRLNYQIYGKGAPIVFIHGFSGYQEIWTMQLDYFVKRGFQVITYDQRNHGASQTDFKLNNMNRLIKDLKELIDYLQLKRPVLVGHSMGGSVIYGFLKKYMNYTLTGAVSVDESPKMIGNKSWPYGFMNAMRFNYRLKLKEFPNVKETLNGICNKCRQRVRVAQQQFPFDWKINEALLLNHVRRDWRDSIINTKTALLLLTANQSPFYDGHYADVMHDKNPQYVHHIPVDQSGHCIMAEQPDKFNQVVSGFISNVR